VAVLECLTNRILTRMALCYQSNNFCARLYIRKGAGGIKRAS
jgi:hypothetical protein